MKRTQCKPLEQLQYWQGQALQSRDFNDELDSAEQLRWWHNRASHGAFGIGFGLTVDADWTVHCGAAYDCFGRELVIAENRPAAPPATGAPQYLALTWTPTGAALAWIPPAQASRTAGVLLARAQNDGKLDSAFHAVHALALSRPRISSGSTPAGNTPWEKIKNVNGLAIGLRTHIDTSAAGFTKVPLYLVSPVWVDGANDRFTPPYVLIDDMKEDGFTVRLLLQGSGGQEKFEVEADIETLSPAEWLSHNVTPFTSNDPLARLIPRVEKLLEIVAPAIPGNVLTFATAPALNAGDSVALVNLPVNPAVTRSLTAINVASAAQFDGTVVIRRDAAVGGFAAGDAAEIERVLTTSQLLLPKSPIRALGEGDVLDIAQELGEVQTVSAHGLTVTLKTAATLVVKKNNIAVRTSADVKSEVPVVVNSQSADKKSVTLVTAIPALGTGDKLGVTQPRLAAQPGGAVLHLVDTLITSEVEKFRAGDVLGGAGGTSAVLTAIEEDVLVVDSPLTIAADGTVSIGNYGAKSTITAPPTAAPNVKVRRAEQFVTGDLLALVKGTKPGAAEIRTVSTTTPGVVNLNKAFTTANVADVVAAVRLSAISAITALSPLTVADASKFRKGDLVTLAADPAVCWEIAEIQAGNIVKLKTGGPAVTGTLALVTVDMVAKVLPSGGAAGPASITIDGPAVARKGWYGAQITSWKDATDPATLDTALPDGTLPGDSIGFAAFTPAQVRLHFAGGVKVPVSTPLVIEGPDQLSGADQRVFASVQQQPDSGPATLQVSPASVLLNFNLRPEALSVLAVFPLSLADDFAAYAQQQGLALYWLGCELPGPPPPDCPGIPRNGTCSCQ